MEAGTGIWHDLVARGGDRNYEAGDCLIRWDADDGSVLAVRHGMCKVVNSTGDGRESLIAVRGAGDIVGELAALTGDVRSASVIALSDVRVSALTRSEFLTWLDQEPGVAVRLATMLARRLVETTRPGVGAHQRVPARLADRILFLAERFGADGAATGDELRLPLTHEDFASWIGATRSVTSRALAELRREGLIDFGRGRIRIVDPDGLATVRLRG